MSQDANNDCDSKNADSKVGGPGRPHIPTTENRIKVRAWTSTGVRQELQAGMLGIGVDCLRRHYDDELKTSKADCIDLIAGGLAARAINGNDTAAIFYLKTQAGWKEAPSLGDKDNPLVIADQRELALRAAAELRATLGKQAPTTDNAEDLL